MTLFYYDPLFLKHETGRHPECPARVESVVNHLKATGLAEALTACEWQPATDEQLVRIHAPDYIQQVKQFADSGGGWIEGDTFCSPRSNDAARSAAGAACDAVERVLGGRDRTAFCLVRPPGHHALTDAAMGFCLFNNAAVAAKHAIINATLNRVLIVDWDVHHGNGTQDEFWEDEQVGLISIHRWPFYPGTGRADETGGGAALGTKLNLPVEFGISRRAYLDQFRSALEWLARKIRPELVIISAGFDAHRDDPIGSLGLETEDFGELTRAVLDVADEYCQGKVVSVLEGGYNVVALANSVETHLRALLAR